MPTTKRTDYLHWPDYFMATAFLAAQRSKDPHTQVGAVIVNAANRIVGIGYNGLPRGCSDDLFPWHKRAADDDDDDDRHSSLDQKFMYVCHAEVNAVLNKNCPDVSGCTLYVALFPCNECAKVIIQSGIRRIVYMSDTNADKPSTRAARRMFEASGVRCQPFQGGRNAQRIIAIDFGRPHEATVRMRSALTLSDDDDDDDDDEVPTTPVPEGKRADYLSWPDYFMAVAVLSAQRSKDPNTQVGACIVNAANRIVGIGYNGFPHGCDDDAFPWTRPADAAAAAADDDVDPLDNKHLYVCHAEVNAILNKNAADAAGCTIYVTLFPCNECAKIVIQSGIRRVVYVSDKYAQSVETVAAKRMFEAANVECEPFVPGRERIVIDLGEIERRNFSQLPVTPSSSSTQKAV